MAITLKSGFIYFLGEKDALTGETTDYVKIGKTDFDREVSDRIDEHQTGNPRVVFDRGSFQVLSVDTVETHLHHAFAEYRVLGEWFCLGTGPLKAAMEEGSRLNALLEEARAALATEAEAKNTESCDPERPPREEERDLLQNAVQVGEELNRLNAARSRLEWALRAGMGSALGIDGILTATPVIRQRVLDEEGLKSQTPEIYEKFLVETKGLSRSFALASKTRSPAQLEPVLAAEQAVFKEQVAKALDTRGSHLAERTAPLCRFHEDYLRLLGKISRASIEKDLLEVQIKSACGSAKGIEGVCKWARTLKTKVYFDRKAFKKVHPELFERHLLPAEPSSLRWSVKPMRSY